MVKTLRLDELRDLNRIGGTNDISCYLAGLVQIYIVDSCEVKKLIYVSFEQPKIICGEAHIGRSYIAINRYDSSRYPGRDLREQGIESFPGGFVDQNVYMALLAYQLLYEKASDKAFCTCNKIVHVSNSRSSHWVKNSGITKDSTQVGGISPIDNWWSIT